MTTDGLKCPVLLASVAVRDQIVLQMPLLVVLYALALHIVHTRIYIKDTSIAPEEPTRSLSCDAKVMMAGLLSAASRCLRDFLYIQTHHLLDPGAASRWLLSAAGRPMMTP